MSPAKLLAYFQVPQNSLPIFSNWHIHKTYLLSPLIVNQKLYWFNDETSDRKEKFFYPNMNKHQINATNSECCLHFRLVKGPKLTELSTGSPKLLVLCCQSVTISICHLCAVVSSFSVVFPIFTKLKSPKRLSKLAG